MPDELPNDLQGNSVSSDIPCLRCGYSLKGLHLGDVCPECAQPIAESLSHYSISQDHRPPPPLTLCIVRVMYLGVAVALLVLGFVVGFLHSGIRLGRLPFVDEAVLVLLCMLGVGLVASIAGMRYRRGDRWMTIWAVAFAASMLAVAFFSIV